MSHAFDTSARAQARMERGDLHQYRLLLNLQRVQFRHLAEPNRSFLPDFAKEEEADDDLCGVANFLYQNGFRCITERSDAGWTPICFAALDGEPRLMLKLIESHADVNASLTKPEPLLGFGVGTCCLSIAAYVKNNEALQLLISHRADLNHVDSFSATVAHWAAVGGNTEGLRILRDAGASFEGANVLGYSPFRMACSGGHVEAMKMLLAHTPLLEVDLGVHTAILHEGRRPFKGLVIPAGSPVSIKDREDKLFLLAGCGLPWASAFSWSTSG
ncbi:Ankyrin repeat and KH domain-containing protein 1 (HIV-1 Vpr-binding ankyrin repeat protein) (Multiple ankyrin repeats single KH domain) (hMASK) [Durusdinium trenchii]|uniref:Ankyrin repeat and KH domain-containing protein 1 (HIV-1 Vpr-binding ankyrin repeat protein) (Multiple ankyrin repeats single KH domain) (HMASK) n=1 Tax=Durusdinium trenchii TaxID=1381693 RepID=A0ABP0RP02_9DINO